MLLRRPKQKPKRKRILEFCGNGPVEDFADLNRQGAGSERFLKKSHTCFQNSTVSDDVVRVPGHEENLCSRVVGSDAAGEVTAADARHHHVGKQKVNLA